MKKQKLKMSFDPNTIEHLGVKMYSNLPNALAELIANAYDADAKKVVIKLIDHNKEKEIEVTDDGLGMSFEEINEKFLRIGRNRRQNETGQTKNGRKVTGKKGLGKLALFGLGETITVHTAVEGSKEATEFTLDWMQIKKIANSQDYEPDFQFKKKTAKVHGTTIVLKNLKRKSNFDPASLAESISKLFNSMDSQFEIYVEYKGQQIKVDLDLRYNSIVPQFEWTFSDLAKEVAEDYEFKNKIHGKILSTEKPIKPALRGITLFARGRLVNLPEFFGVSESSHGFSYFTGWLNVDFIDDWDEDVISTDRQSLNWDLPKTSSLREYLANVMRTLLKLWRAKRNELRIIQIEQEANIKVGDWYSKLPSGIRLNIEKIVNMVENKSELESDDYQSLIATLHSIIPEYPYYHWRNLHPEVGAAAQKHYQSKDFYQAFMEAAKRYLNQTKAYAAYTGDANQGMMGKVFGNTPGRPLRVTKSYKRPDGTDFNASTLGDIEDGQMHMSMGVIAGCRNPISHEEVEHLRESKLFTEKDCLDALSLLSHLFRRLEDAK